MLSDRCPKCRRYTAFVVLEKEIVCTKCGHRIPKTELPEELKVKTSLKSEPKPCRCGEKRDEDQNR